MLDKIINRNLQKIDLLINKIKNNENNMKELLKKRKPRDIIHIDRG